MAEQEIERIIGEALKGEARKNALDFVAFLRENEMLLERGRGYWEDKLYWLIKYKNEYVCFMLIDGSGEKVEPGGWTVWFDDGESGCFGHFPLDEPMREIAWENVDFCGNCGGCNRGAGTCKMIFGKEFDSV